MILPTGTASPTAAALDDSSDAIESRSIARNFSLARGDLLYGLDASRDELFAAINGRGVPEPRQHWKHPEFVNYPMSQSIALVNVLARISEEELIEMAIQDYPRAEQLLRDTLHLFSGKEDADRERDLDRFLFRLNCLIGRREVGVGPNLVSKLFIRAAVQEHRSDPQSERYFLRQLALAEDVAQRRRDFALARQRQSASEEDGSQEPPSKRGRADLEESGRTGNFLETAPPLPGKACAGSSRTADASFEPSEAEEVSLQAKRASKLGIIALAMPQSAHHIHFALDNIDIPAVVRKDGRHGQSITASELRAIYRLVRLTQDGGHAGEMDIAARLHFYMNRTEVVAPWTADQQLWLHYVPHGHKSFSGLIPGPGRA